MSNDVIVLGAGMVGVSTALHLQQRGRSVALVDRRGVAEETSYGNTGIIQREGIVPYLFPREWATILRHARNKSTEAAYQLSSLPSIAGYMFRYWRWSTPEGKASTAKAMTPLITRCVDEHEHLMTEAGITGMMRRTGYLRLYRNEKEFDAAVREDEANKRAYGVNAKPVDRAGIAELEPHIKPVYAGGVFLADPVSVADPEAVGKAYGHLFTGRGGTFAEGEARSLTADGAGWKVATRDGWISAPDVVVALGPWSDTVTRAQGLRLPFGVKRGYHMHYRAEGNATLSRPIIDTSYGYAMTQMTKGIRVTTGAEFATRDAPPNPVQLDRVEPLARMAFPIAERLEAEPWLGRRPCLPDMLPVVGQAGGRNGLWLNFGHHHLGFTLGPVTGRLLAEMMTGEKPFTDPHPYRAERF
ncbi:MAG: NAD(P)/FAD-dependent oxidoreductase [Hyphomicrobiaceae bacterium]